MLPHGMYIQRVHKDVVVNLPLVRHYPVRGFMSSIDELI